MGPGSRHLRRLVGRLRTSGPDPSERAGVTKAEFDRLEAIFDAEWYLDENPDVAASDHDPWAHFAGNGLFEDRNPSPLFDPHYFARHGGTPEGTPKILHYLRVGDEGLRTASALFDVAWYRSQVGRIEGVTLLEHYLVNGRTRPISPNRFLSPAWILNGLGRAGLGERTPMEHYVAQGPDGELDPHPWFANSAYRHLQADVRDAGVLPLAHFCEWSQSQGRHVHRFLDLLGPNSVIDTAVTSPAGEVALIEVAELAIVPWLRDEPLPTALVEHLATAHRTAARSLALDATGQLSIDWARRAREVDLASSPSPVVSVVIPTLDHAGDVIRCLESIASSKDSTPCEILLIDDGSSQEDADLFALPRGLRVVRNDPNRGFAQSCARGVEVSSAPAVMFLNNDTEVLPGWLDHSTSLLLDDTRHAGAIGTMVLAADLVLQDAGCQLVGEGWPVQVGRWENPMDATYNLVRPITYGSGCSLLVSREAFDAVGGFDPQFEPAFFEENDLCRMIAGAGYEVLYEPGAVVIHREGSTLGRQGTEEREVLFQRQAERYLAKWEGVATDLPPRGTRPFDLVFAEPFKGKCVLVIDHRLPEPNHDSGSLRMTQILLELKRQGRTPVVLSASDFVRASSAALLTRAGIGVLTTHLEDPEVSEILRRVLPEVEFVIVSRPHVALAALPMLRELYPDTPVVFDSVDSHTLRAERRHALESTEDSARAIQVARLAERSILEQADVAIALSLEDQAALADLCDTPPPFVLLPNIHPALAPASGPEQRQGLLFVGGYEHDPNVDGAIWFVSEVLPRVTAQVGEIEVILAGSKPTAEVLDLRSDSVAVPGWIEDLGPLYEGARVAIAPLRFGAGVKGKVGEALAFGLPMVSTTIGAEGMGLTPGEDIEVADDPQSFADAVVRLLRDDEHWRRLSLGGREAIDRSMGLGAAERSVTTLLETVHQVDRRLGSGDGG